MGTLRRAFVICAGAALFSALSVERAWACSCGGIPTFEDEVRDASIVLVGRVTAIGERKYGDDPSSITLAVERTLKGAAHSSVVVWNEGAGSSCGGLFTKLDPGTSVALAVVRVTDVEQLATDMWTPMNFHPPPGDLLVRLGCGQPLKTFASDRERDRWLKRRR